MGDILLTRDYSELESNQEYKIFIDGKEVSSIKNNTRKLIKLPEGKHNIYVKVMGVSSKPKTIEVKAKETLRLSCGSNLTGLKFVFHWFFAFSKNKIYLKQTI